MQLMTADEQLLILAGGIALVLFILAVALAVLFANRSRASAQERERARAAAQLREMQTAVQQYADAAVQRIGEQLQVARTQLEEGFRAEQAQRRQAQAALEEARTELQRRLDTRVAELSQRVQQNQQQLLQQVQTQAQQLTQQAQEQQQQSRQAADTLGQELTVRVQAAAESLGQQMAQQQRAVEESTMRLSRLEKEIGQLHLQVALAHAVATGERARTHLKEQEAGLAEHDLTELEDNLERVRSLSPAHLRPNLDMVRRGVQELKGSVEARTFPVAAVELLTDRIRALLPLTPVPARPETQALPAPTIATTTAMGPAADTDGADQEPLAATEAASATEATRAA